MLNNDFEKCPYCGADTSNIFKIDTVFDFEARAYYDRYFCDSCKEDFSFYHDEEDEEEDEE